MTEQTLLRQRMPILILAGSDERPAPTPATLEADDLLTGYKGAFPLPSGRCLAAELIARLRDTKRFCDPLLLGPRRIYEGLVDCEIIDTEGAFVETLRRVVELMQTRFAGNEPMAVASCDILPSASDVIDLLSSAYDPHANCCFWWQLVSAEPATLGPSAWKPHYRIRSLPGKPAEIVYPGHLVVLRPAAVRMDVLSGLLSLAYRYRNWTPRRRMPPMLVRGIGLMLLADLRNLLRGQLPILALAIPWHVYGAYRDLQTQQLTMPGLERRATHVLLHRHYRQLDRPVVIATTRIQSFARDIDTTDEIAAVRAEFDACR
jgi:hypothetical protein